MSLTIVAPERLPRLLTDRTRAPLRLPHLEALLGRSTITVGHGPIERWLCAQLGVASNGDPPIAALRLAAEAQARLDSLSHANAPDAVNARDGPLSHADARDGYWLCADPIATTMGIDSVRIDRVVDDLSMDDAQSLTSSLTGFFAADGLRFVAPSAAHWYVHSPAPQRISTTTLSRALGGSMLPCMPTGADAPAWRARLNEAQMLLHAHPANAGREGRGQLAVASCWWWGGGSWPEFSTPMVDAMIGGPDWACAAARESGIDIEADADLRLRIHDSRRTLLIATSTEAAEDDWMVADQRWFGQLRADDYQGTTIVIPWLDDTMIVEIGVAADRATGWRRSLGWLGRLGAEPAPAAPIGDALQRYLQQRYLQ